MFVEIVDEKSCNVSIFMFVYSTQLQSSYKKEGYYYKFKLFDKLFRYCGLKLHIKEFSMFNRE